MASSNDNVSMALFCDFENVALGVRDANYDKFDIKPVLERLLLKGSIVVKKAYCDWDRYKAFKAPMHEANFELIEIPHVRQSGKNSADIRMVVDALDLCYTKSHVDTFVIISGDSDFSPLVSKLRENAKKVIGVGVKQSTSDLLVANCDEFIFYDDLVRESRRSAAARRDPREAAPAAPKRSPEEEKKKRDEMDKRRDQAVEIAVDTFEALVSERGDSGKIWASVLKEAIKRRKPDFSESYYGFRTFGNLIEEAKARGLLEFGRDEKSGAYVYRSSNAGLVAGEAAVAQDGVEQDGVSAGEAVEMKQESRPERTEGRQENKQDGKSEPRRGRGRGGRSQAERYAERQERNAEREQQAAQTFEPVADQALAEHVDAGDDEDARADAEAIRIRDNRRQQPEAVQVHGDFDTVQENTQSEPRRGRGNRGRNQSGRKGGERNTGNPVAAEPVISARDIAPAADADAVHAAEPVVDLDAMDEVEAQADQRAPQTDAAVAKRARNAKLPARKAKAAAKPKPAISVESPAAVQSETRSELQAQPESLSQQPVVVADTADQADAQPYGKWKGKPRAEPTAEAGVEQSAEPVADNSATPAAKPNAKAKTNGNGKAGGKAASNNANGKASGNEIGKETANVTANVTAKAGDSAKARPAAKPKAAKAAKAATAPLFEELVPVAIAPDVVVADTAVAGTDTSAGQPAKAKPARKPAPRRPAKPKASGDA